MRTWLARPHKLHICKALCLAIGIVIDQPLPTVGVAVVNESVENRVRRRGREDERNRISRFLSVGESLCRQASSSSGIEPQANVLLRFRVPADKNDCFIRW